MRQNIASLVIDAETLKAIDGTLAIMVGGDAKAFETVKPILDKMGASVVLVGDIDLAGLYAGFIRFKLPLSAEFKRQIIDGNPSLLLWPEEFFDSKWNPMNRQSGQAAGA